MSGTGFWALTPFLTKGIAGGTDYLSSNDNPQNHIRIPYISSPDWSRNLVTGEQKGVSLFRWGSDPVFCLHVSLFRWGSDPVFCLQPVRRMLKYPYG